MSKDTDPLRGNTFYNEMDAKKEKGKKMMKAGCSFDFGFKDRRPVEEGQEGKIRRKSNPALAFLKKSKSADSTFYEFPKNRKESEKNAFMKRRLLRRNATVEEVPGTVHYYLSNYIRNQYLENF